MKTIFILALTVLLYSCQDTKDEVAEEATEIKDELKQETQELKDDAAEINPPDAPARSLARDFPDVKNPDWEKEGDRYEASFTRDGKETTVVYNADGTRYATETEISTGDLPSVVQKAASANGNITEACKIMLAGGTVQYEVESGSKDYVYDEKGNLVATEQDDDDDDDGDDD